MRCVNQRSLFVEWSLLPPHTSVDGRHSQGDARGVCRCVQSAVQERVHGKVDWMGNLRASQ